MYEWMKDCSVRAASWPFDLLLDYHIDLLYSFDLLFTLPSHLEEFRLKSFWLRLGFVENLCSKVFKKEKCFSSLAPNDANSGGQFLFFSYFSFKRDFHFSTQWLSIPWYCVSWLNGDRVGWMRRTPKIFLIISQLFYVFKTQTFANITFHSYSASPVNTSLALINWITCNLMIIMGWNGRRKIIMLSTEDVGANNNFRFAISKQH